MLYTGYTSNIERRIQQHNEGLTTSTADRRPLCLNFCEYYLFREDAQKRELYLKTTMGKKALKRMLSGTLQNLGYAPVHKGR